MKLLQSLIENSPVDLHEDEKQQGYNLLSKQQRSFSKSFWDLGLTDKVQHKFNTRYSITLITPQLGCNDNALVEVSESDRETNRLVSVGKVREWNSSWEAPVVLATKKDGNPRLCVDYRRLNFVTVKDSFSLPRIDYSLDCLSGANCSSTLGIAFSCQQVAWNRLPYIKLYLSNSGF